MAKPPIPPGGDHRPPKFQSLKWTNPQASGFLYCDETRCCERGNWTGWPYLVRNRTLVQAARAWYQARCARMKREGIRFFEGVAVPTPQAVTRSEEPPPAKTPKPKRKKMKSKTKTSKAPKGQARKKVNRKRRSVRN